MAAGGDANHESVEESVRVPWAVSIQRIDAGRRRDQAKMPSRWPRIASRPSAMSIMPEANTHGLHRYAMTPHAIEADSASLRSWRSGLEQAGWSSRKLFAHNTEIDFVVRAECFSAGFPLVSFRL